MKIYVHDDQDGALSAYWIEKAKDEGKIPDDGFFCKTFVLSHDRKSKIPMKDVKPGETVIIADFSILPEEMEELQEITPNVYWFDHHISAIDKYKNYATSARKQLPMGYRSDGISASALVALWYFWEEYVGTKRVDDSMLKACVSRLPMFAQYVNDHDIWTKQIPESDPFILGTECHDYMKSDFWKACAEDPAMVEDCVNAGKIIQKHKKSSNPRTLGKIAYEVLVSNPSMKGLYGKRILAVNGAGKGSAFFGDYIKTYDFCMAYSVVGDNVSVSLYSEKEDCSKASTSLGGGGHKGAAGFRMDFQTFTDTFKFTKMLGE